MALSTVRTRVAVVVTAAAALAAGLTGCSKPVHYASCDAVHAAGIQVLHKGDPGYSTNLDADRDGTACEASGGAK